MEPEGLEYYGIFIFYQVRPKLEPLLHTTGFVISDMHTIVSTYLLLCRGHDLVKMMPGESIFEQIGRNWRLSPLFCAVQTPFSLFCGSNSIVTHFFVCEGQLSPFFLL